MPMQKSLLNVLERKQKGIYSYLNGMQLVYKQNGNHKNRLQSLLGVFKKDDKR
jgi:hypothetical protein